MSKLETSNLMDNEILKAADVNGALDAQISNVTKALQCLLEIRQDFIIGPKNPVTFHSEEEDDWTINVSPILGICFSTGQIGLDTTSNLAAVTPPVDLTTRVDTVQIRGVYKTSNEEQRAFIDFDTKATSLENVDTKKYLDLEIQVIQNTTERSIAAPNHTEGWVKIAEIYIPGDATKISDCTIYNITSDVYGVENEDWTSEKTSTYNMGHISDVNNRFRQEHKADGSHKDDCITAANLRTGTNNGDVNGVAIPSGSSVTIGGTPYSANASVTNLISAIATTLTTISGEKNDKITVTQNDTALTDNDSFIQMETGQNPTTAKKHLLSKLWTWIRSKTNSTLVTDSTVPVNSVAVMNGLAAKQNNLVSGTNIKTINNQSVLGSGNLEIKTSTEIIEIAPEFGKVQINYTDLLQYLSDEELIPVDEPFSKTFRYIPSELNEMFFIDYGRDETYAYSLNHALFEIKGFFHSVTSSSDNNLVMYFYPFSTNFPYESAANPEKIILKIIGTNVKYILNANASSVEGIDDDVDDLKNDKLDKSGGTMTGTLNLIGDHYWENNHTPALDAKNSGIVGLNNLVFNDVTNTGVESVIFPKTTANGYTGIFVDGDGNLKLADITKPEGGTATVTGTRSIGSNDGFFMDASHYLNFDDAIGNITKGDVFISFDISFVSAVGVPTTAVAYKTTVGIYVKLGSTLRAYTSVTGTTSNKNYNTIAYNVPSSSIISNINFNTNRGVKVSNLYMYLETGSIPTSGFLDTSKVRVMEGTYPSDTQNREYFLLSPS